MQSLYLVRSWRLFLRREFNIYQAELYRQAAEKREGKDWSESINTYSETCSTEFKDVYVFVPVKKLFSLVEDENLRLTPILLEENNCFGLKQVEGERTTTENLEVLNQACDDEIEHEDI